MGDYLFWSRKSLVYFFLIYIGFSYHITRKLLESYLNIKQASKSILLNFSRGHKK